jgi:hypothetical protein
MISTISRFIIALLVPTLLVLGGTSSFVMAAAKKAPKKSQQKAKMGKTAKKKAVVQKGSDYEVNGVFPTVTGSDWLAVANAYRAAGKKNKAEKALYFSDKLKIAENQARQKGK